MKVKAPQPFTFGEGKRAVLLLHGFTGHSADVRMLGRFLEKKGYTCHAPIMKGHGGATPEELMTTGPDEWWKDVMDAYKYLQDRGHKEIAVGGLSLGGVFSLKLGYTVPIKGIVSMCAPTSIKSEQIMYEGVLEYSRNYKKIEGKSPEEIEKEMDEFQKIPIDTIKALQNLIADVRDHIDMIYAPLFVVQARNDGMINTESANVIYNRTESTQKEIKWYEHSRHVITLDKEKDQLHEDVYQFLETLDWED